MRFCTTILTEGKSAAGIQVPPEIVEGSGTGELRGITGRASVDAVKADTQTVTLEYDLD